MHFCFNLILITKETENVFMAYWPFVYHLLRSASQKRHFKSLINFSVGLFIIFSLIEGVLYISWLWALHWSYVCKYFIPLPLLTLFIYLKKLFIYFRFCWVFIAAHGLSLVAASRGYSLRWLVLLWSTGFRCTGFSSCGSQASVVVAHRL